jgi:putative ABC transport system substrate-binding protein
MIGRREFITLLGGAVAWPLAVRAQQIKSVRRLGVLMPEAENDAQSQAQVRALEHGLTQLGWSPGKNLQIDYRWAAGDLHETRLAAAELVRLAPDVLLAAATPPVRALQQATNTIPIVFAGITEPVAQGLVASLAHPGGNLTGFSNMEATFGEKWLELLKEIDPRVTRAAIVFNPQTAPITADLLHNVEVAAQMFAIHPDRHSGSANFRNRNCCGDACTRARWRHDPVTRFIHYDQSQTDHRSRGSPPVACSLPIQVLRRRRWPPFLWC